MILNFFLGGGGASAGRPFTFELKTLGENVGYCQSLSSDLVLLGANFNVIDECIPSKIFKMASNSFKITDVPFSFAPPPPPIRLFQ